MINSKKAEIVDLIFKQTFPDPVLLDYDKEGMFVVYSPWLIAEIHEKINQWFDGITLIKKYHGQKS